jgi:hypothetical protein
MVVGAENPWEALPRQAPYIAPADRVLVDAAFQQRYSLECGVLPVPFIGDSRSAPVVLLQLNPGYDELDPEDEVEIDGYAEALRAAMVFSSDGFFPLDRRFKRTNGAFWWRPRLGQLIEACGREAVFRGLACIEYFPYHSATWGWPPDVPSQDFTFAAVRSALARGAILVLMRGRAAWVSKIPALPHHPNVISHRVPRSSYLTAATLEQAGFDRVVHALKGHTT